MAAPNIRVPNVSQESGEATSFNIKTSSLHVHHDDDLDICSVRKSSEQKRTIFDTFFYSGLHDISDPQNITDVYAVAEITTQDGCGSEPEIIIGQNQRPRIHAETDLIEKLRTFFVTSQTIVNIKIWINFSPCHKCSQELLSFYQDKRLSIGSLIIVFPFLYRITLPKSVEGLRTLKSNGIFLSTFSSEDWEQLQLLLNASGLEDYITDDRVARARQDENNAEQFLRLMTT